MDVVDDVDEKIRYKAGYKYQLFENYVIDVGIFPVDPVTHRYMHLSARGVLTIFAGYAWDGASGPALDTVSFMRGSLVHDALYQMMKEGFLPWAHKRRADALLTQLCGEDGMPAWRRAYVWAAVRVFGKLYSDSNKGGVLEAP